MLDDRIVDINRGQDGAITRTIEDTPPHLIDEGVVHCEGEHRSRLGPSLPHGHVGVDQHRAAAPSTRSDRSRSPSGRRHSIWIGAPHGSPHRLGKGDIAAEIGLQDATGEHNAVVAELFSDLEFLRGPACAEVHQFMPDLRRSYRCHGEPPRQPTRIDGARLRVRCRRRCERTQLYTSYGSSMHCTTLNMADAVTKVSRPWSTIRTPPPRPANATANLPVSGKS